MLKRAQKSHTLACKSFVLSKRPHVRFYSRMLFIFNIYEKTCAVFVRASDYGICEEKAKATVGFVSQS
jgi:hypothetical protein